MGNVFTIKNQNSKSNSLSRSLLHHDLMEKINYLYDKVEMLDDKVYVLESNTQANFKVMSSDIHLLGDKLKTIMK
tara:strand:+ start:1443 stop:1667 length:225 start_codon:yes stop_codon:yes gene_type:complete